MSKLKGLVTSWEEHVVLTMKENTKNLRRRLLKLTKMFQNLKMLVMLCLEKVSLFFGVSLILLFVTACLTFGYENVLK